MSPTNFCKSNSLFCKYGRINSIAFLFTSGYFSSLVICVSLFPCFHSFHSFSTTVINIIIPPPRFSLSSYSFCPSTSPAYGILHMYFQIFPINFNIRISISDLFELFGIVAEISPVKTFI